MIERYRPGAFWSAAASVAPFVFLSGQTARGAVIADGILSQTAEVLRRIDELLLAAGSHKSHVVAATIYLKDMRDFSEMNEIWGAWITPDCQPSRTTVQAHLASSELLVEITVIAVKCVV